MQTTGNTVLITGGATGIGFALARRMLEAGNHVIICGRREAKLREAKTLLGQLQTRVCDLTRSSERQHLVDQLTTEFPELNILVNNAGIQRQIDLTKGADELMSGEDEVAANLEAPIHLSALFIPHLTREDTAAIVNVTSGLGFTPLAILPVYCATKAALHAFSLSLRHQLVKTPIRVFEVIPPTVDTDLDRGAREKRGQTDRGVPPDDVARATLEGIASDTAEIVIGAANNLRSDPSRMFGIINH